MKIDRIKKVEPINEFDFKSSDVRLLSQALSTVLFSIFGGGQFGVFFKRCVKGRF